MNETLTFRSPTKLWFNLALGTVLGAVLLSTIALLWFARPFAAATPVAGGDRLVLTTRTMAFQNSRLSAPAGNVTLTLDNDDFLPHTFTIDSLGINVEVAGRSTGAVSFAAQPGIYTFYCAIPGHRAAGMVGTLEVTPQ